MAKALDESQSQVTSNRSYENVDALGSAIYLAYLAALNSYTCVREMTAGCGFADMVYIPVHPDVQRHLWFEKKGIYGLRKRHLWFEKKAFMV